MIIINSETVINSFFGSKHELKESAPLLTTLPNSPNLLKISSFTDFNDACPGYTQEASLWNGCVTNTAIEVAQFGPEGAKAIPTLSDWSVIILVDDLDFGCVGCDDSSQFYCCYIH